MADSRLVCGGQELPRLFHVDRFPLVIGAVPADRAVPEHPLTIAACRACSLVQQVGRLDKETVDTLYSADYYSCPSPLLTGMGTGEIDKFHFEKEIQGQLASLGVPVSRIEPLFG